MPTTSRRARTAPAVRTAPAARTAASSRAGSSKKTSTRSSKRTPRRRVGATGAGDAILHLDRWIRENRRHLKPPVSNRQLFTESDDAIVFVSGGPNTRNDYHVNPTEELFLQVKGDIAVRIRPLDGSPPRDVVIREGELYLLPRWVPHRPQRPAGTVGLIIEFPRPEGEKDGLRWYCPACDELVHEATWRLKRIDEDLKVIMERFWSGPVKRRTCRGCGTVIERAGEFQLAATGRRRTRSAERPASRRRTGGAKKSEVEKSGAKTSPAKTPRAKTSRSATSRSKAVKSTAPTGRRRSGR